MKNIWPSGRYSFHQRLYHYINTKIHFFIDTFPFFEEVLLEIMVTFSGFKSFYPCMFEKHSSNFNCIKFVAEVIFNNSTHSFSAHTDNRRQFSDRLPWILRNQHLSLLNDFRRPDNELLLVNFPCWYCRTFDTPLRFVILLDDIIHSRTWVSEESKVLGV